MISTWEQRKLGEVCQEFKSGTSLKADQIDTAGDYPVYGGNGLRGYTSDYNHDGEFALIGRQGALCGNMNYSVGKAYFTEHAVVVDADINNDIKFLYYMLDTMNLGQYSDQSAQPGLAVNKLVKLENLFPTKEEQRRIGRYFSNIDHLITLHQRKLEHVKKMKKSMLQKMFPKKNQLYPEVRFPGFTDAWEQRKLGEVCQEFKSGTSLKADQIDTAGDYPVYGGNGLRGYTSDYNHDGEFALIGRQGALCGNMNYSVGKAYFTEHAVVVDADINNDIKFLYYMLDTMNLGQYSDQSAQPGLAVNKLVKLENLFPTKEEQRRIGRYFSNIDHLITLHQRKLEHVKKMKKSMLQKMFPKKNQLYPEVRFPGFTDAWEQRKFSEFTWNAGKRNKEDLDLEPYAITNEHGFIKQSEAHDDFGYMKDTDRKAYNIVMPNSFAYNPARINVGSIGYYEGTENVIVSSLYEVFQTADYVDDRFLWHWFKSDEFPKWIERLQEGSVRLYFYYDKLCECQMLMPSVPEQKKIAEALDNLDNLITLHQRELDHLQLLKKGMLQQMFI